jgi:AcrR family transcriptional regulator
MSALPEVPRLNTRQALLESGLRLFNAQGFDRTTVADLRRAAAVSNGSFFHAFASKEQLAGELLLMALGSYHRAMIAALAGGPGAAEGVRALVVAHLDWVVCHEAEARFLFEQSRADWAGHVREGRQAENAAFSEAIARWREPLAAAGFVRPLPPAVLASQIVGPAQMFCRAWLSGRDGTDPRSVSADLAECAIRAVVFQKEQQP